MERFDLPIKARLYRELLLDDRTRPMYHFTAPDGNVFPGDPNGAFYADGVYHLMYLYENSITKAFHWGHISSKDLLHWRHHKDALTGINGDRGANSGGAFIDDDKTAYIAFMKFPIVKEGKTAEDYEKDEKNKCGIMIAYAKPPYDDWIRMDDFAVLSDKWGIQHLEVDGEIVHLGNADPSNIWKENGTYYMQTGNLCVLNAYGKGENALEKYKGDWTELYSSTDLKKWKFVHRFYDRNTNLESLPDLSEDSMCPCFLPLYDAKENGKKTGKYLQIFISHVRGAQYYIGTFENEKFYPEKHGRFTWNDIAYAAPEALVDHQNRMLMWAWIVGNRKDEYEKYLWTGVHSFPRVIWLEGDELRMAPAKELDSLQFHHQEFTKLQDCKVPVKNGESFRLKAVCQIDAHSKIGFQVRVDEEKNEHTDIYVDTQAHSLVMDTTNSGNDGYMIKEEAPFVLPEGEKVYLDIFVDRSIIEVYVNEKQAICRCVYPTEPQNAVGVSVIGDVSAIEKLDVWEMFPTNMY